MPSTPRTRPHGSARPYLLIVLCVVVLIGGWVFYSRAHAQETVKFVTVESKMPAANTIIISPLSGKPHPLSEYRVDIENPTRVICPDTLKPFSRKKLFRLANAASQPSDTTTQPTTAPSK
jgi:hypothetical protein